MTKSITQNLKEFEKELTQCDYSSYEHLTTDKLTSQQKQIIANPEQVYEREESVLAVHWHPETIPVDLADKRINKLYPNRKHELIIPTQHNCILEYKGFCGVEVDCYSPEFNRKVQLLLHFSKENLKDSHVLESMILHTFKYRQTQLFEFIDIILNPKREELLRKAVEKTKSEKELVEFVKTFTLKVKKLIDEKYSTTPQFSIKNKLLANYFRLLKNKNRKKLFLQKKNLG